MRIFILCLVMNWVASAGSTPGFDCKKAQTSDEKLICSNSSLMKLDRELNEVYLSRVKKEPVIKKDQLSWIQSRQARCEMGNISIGESAKAACLEFEYRRRITLLESSQQPDRSADVSATEGSVGNVVFRQIFTLDGETQCLRYIDVYLPGQIVPQQTISQENCGYPPGDYLSFEDFNFDGYPDLSILNKEASGATNLIYEVYLFNPEKREFFREPTFPDESFPEIDKKNKLLLTHSNGGHAGRIGSNTSYRYLNGKYQIESTESREWVPDYCAERDGCDKKDADKKKPGCRILKKCSMENSTLPQCNQYRRTRETFNEKGILVKSEEDIITDDDDTAVKPVAAKVNCAVK